MICAMLLFAKHQLANIAYCAQTQRKLRVLISILSQGREVTQRSISREVQVLFIEQCNSCSYRSAFYQFLATSLYFSSYACTSVFPLIWCSCSEELQHFFETKYRTLLAVPTHLQQHIKPIALSSTGNCTLALYATPSPPPVHSLFPPSTPSVLWERSFQYY